MGNLDEKDLEFGAIDNTGDIRLLDDEELNMAFNTSVDDGISFESIIGDTEDEFKDEPAISTYSTQELNELEKMINESEKAKEDKKKGSLIKNALDDTFDINELTSPIEPITEDNISIDLPEEVEETVEEPVIEVENEEAEEPIVEVETEVEPEEVVEETETVEEPVVEIENEEVEEPVVETKEEIEIVEDKTEEPVEEVSNENETQSEEVNEEENVDFNELESTGITMDLENIRSLDVEDDFAPFTAETFEDPMDDVNMDDLLDKASKNAQEASNIFNQNLELRRQIDEKYNELLKLTEEQENAKNAALTEIENYKNNVYEKLKAQKTDVEEKIAELKLIQSTIEQDRENFEKYRVAEIEKINKSKQEQQAAFEQERTEINTIEEKLIARKARIDQEREQLRLEREKFDQERKNLQINLRKFNELVGGFTTGIDQFTVGPTTQAEEKPAEE